MPVRRHGKTFEARIQAGGRRFSRSFKSHADAKEWENRARRQIEDSRVGRPQRYSLEEAVTRWLDGEVQHLKSPETIKSVLRSILPQIQGRALDEVVDVAAAIEKAGRKANLLPATINRRLAALRRIAKLAYRKWGWLEHDLGAKIQLLPGERKRSRYLTMPEAKRLMAAARGPVREAIRWCLLTGIRRSELMRVTPKDFRDRKLQIDISKSGQPRSVPLHPELDPAKFPYGLDGNALTRGFAKARSRARLEGVWLHDLRRTFGTWALQAGVDLAAIRDLLGHSSIVMTSRYLGASASDLKAAVARLPTLGTGATRGRSSVSRGKKHG